MSPARVASLINAFVLDRMLVIKACSAGELGGFGGSGSGGGSGSSGSSSSIGGGGSDSSFDSVNVPLLRRREPLKWRDSIGASPTHALVRRVLQLHGHRLPRRILHHDLRRGRDHLRGRRGQPRHVHPGGTWKNDASAAACS